MRAVLFGNRRSPLTVAAEASLSALEAVEIAGRVDAGDPRGSVTGDPNSGEGRSALRELRPDLFVSAGYTRILSEETLAIARVGAINVHPSLLPRYRGSYPVYWALYEGEPTTGATVHEMTAEVDAGPILAQEEVSVTAGEDPAHLYARVCAVAGRVLARAVEDVKGTGRVLGRPQAGQASYRDAPARELERLELDFALPAEELARRAAIFPGCVNVRTGRGRVLVHRVRALGAAGGAEAGDILRRRLLGVDVAAGDGLTVALRWLRKPGSWAPAGVLESPLLARRLPGRL